MQTLDIFSGLHNCLEFSQPLSCLHQVMQTRKTFSTEKIKLESSRAEMNTLQVKREVGKRIDYYNVFCKQLDRNEHFSPSELSSASESIQPVLIIWVGLNSN